MSPEGFSNVSKVYEVLYRVLYSSIIVYNAVDVKLRYEKQYEISLLFDISLLFSPSNMY